MNFLQLVNDFLLESGLGDQIGSTVNQEDEYLQAVTWIADAYDEIQRVRRWNFRWAEGSHYTSLNKHTNTLTEMSRASSDELHRNQIWVTESATTDLSTYPGTKRRLAYRHYKPLKEYLKGSPLQLQYGVPKYYAEAPNGDLLLYPIPDDTYGIEYEYFKAPTRLSADSDTPTLPSSYHKMIVWKAMEHYAREQGKEWNALYKASVKNYNAMFHTLLNEETGEVSIRPSPFTQSEY